MKVILHWIAGNRVRIGRADRLWRRRRWCGLRRGRDDATKAKIAFELAEFVWPLLEGGQVRPETEPQPSVLSEALLLLNRQTRATTILSPKPLLLPTQQTRAAPSPGCCVFLRVVRTRHHHLPDQTTASSHSLLLPRQVKAVLDSTFPLADAGLAHARMQSSEHIGKIVLTL